MRNLEKKDTNELRQQTESGLQNYLTAPDRGAGVIFREFGMDMYTPLYLK